MSVFGPDAVGIAEPAGGWLGGSPDGVSSRQQQTRSKPDSPMVKWAKRTRATLIRERQGKTSDMKRNTSLARGGTPWWRDRPKWKIGTKLNYCFTVPATWTAILCDAKPSVSYSALRKDGQRRADLLTAAWDKDYTDYKWERVVHDAIMVARVQSCAYVRLVPKLKGSKIIPNLVPVPGMQLYKNKNARTIDDAETVLYEYKESYGSLCARFPGLRGKLKVKYADLQDDYDGNNDSVLAPPGSYALPTGLNVTTPAYAASVNPPDDSGGTGGLRVWEFWTRPHAAVTVERVQFLSSGEPATKPKLYKTKDPADAEPLRRVVTEGDVIYELPESIVDALNRVPGSIAILHDVPALTAIKQKVKYPLYPDGRLVVIVDQDVEATDRMNPLGYIPFAEVWSNSDPGAEGPGPSDVDLISDVYEQLVRTVSLIYDNANLAGNAIWRIPDSATISNDEITNAPASIQREDMMMLKYGKREGAPDMPNYIMQTVKMLLEQIEKLGGLNDIVQGKLAPKQQISTETFTAHQEASGVRFRDSLSSVSSMMSTLGAHYMEFKARFQTEPMMVQLRGEDGDEQAIPFLGAYLTEPFTVEARAGSRQPNSPSARLNTLLNVKNANVPFPLEDFYSLLEEIGSINSATAIMRRIEKLKANPADQWKILGLPPPPGTPGQKQQSKKPTSKRARSQGATAG